MRESRSHRSIWRAVGILLVFLAVTGQNGKFGCLSGFLAAVTSGVYGTPEISDPRRAAQNFATQLEQVAATLDRCSRSITTFSTLQDEAREQAGTARQAAQRVLARVAEYDGRTSL